MKNLQEDADGNLNETELILLKVLWRSKEELVDPLALIAGGGAE